MRSGSRSRTRSARPRWSQRASSAGPTSASSSRAARRTSSCSTTGSRSSASSAPVRPVSWLETELREQPAALAGLLERESDRVADVAAAFKREDVRYILIASRGSSSNAARYAQYLLGRANRVPVMFATPSLYTIYEQPPRLEGAVVVGISQSGASPDVASVLAEGRRQSRPTIAITNDPTSALAQQADALLPLDEYADAVGATVVGRGVNYCTAFEIALKIRELSGLVVEAYSPADLLHGPIAAIQPDWPVIVVAPTGPARPSVEELALPLRERRARLIAVSDVDAVLRRAHTKLPLVPRVPEWLSPLTAVIPGQLTAMRLAQLRGLDIDNPQGLHKVTL